MKYFLAIGMLSLAVNVGAVFAEIPAGLTGTLIVLNKSSNSASFIRCGISCFGVESEVRFVTGGQISGSVWFSGLPTWLHFG